MKLGNKIKILLLFLILITACSLIEPKQSDQAITEYISNNENTTTIMNWNLQIFGKTKWAKPGAKEEILRIVLQADIIFIQEIRDKSGETFKALCDELNNTHKCNISSRAGRSNSKEQYGIIYKKDIIVVSIHDYNPDPDDQWERPPIRVIFNSSGYVFITYNIHTKPTNASVEIKNLENTIDHEGNIIVLGDLNADCSYYNAEQENDFENWNWIIKDTDDTTVAKSSCAYDRIILNKYMEEKFIRYGIYHNITKEISDHYPVWVEVKAEETI